MKNKVMALIEAELKHAENMLVSTQSLIARSTKAQIECARYGFKGKSLLAVEAEEKTYRDEIVAVKAWFESVVEGLK